MIEWVDFENKLFDFPYFTINNNSKRKIVLFGNCHMATIGYYLNTLFNEQYNIYIIISWFFDKNGLEKFDMNKINNTIHSLISNCDIFIYQQHIKSYGVQADIINSLVNSQTKVFKIPNLRLVYNTESKEEFDKSLHLLEHSIINSDFQEFTFIIENIKDIHFFNTKEHPTHYILYLLSKSIKNKIFSTYKTNKNPFYKPVNIEDYYNQYNRLSYKKITNYVVLPGREGITEQISLVTNIKQNGEYYD